MHVNDQVEEILAEASAAGLRNQLVNVVSKVKDNFNIEVIPKLYDTMFELLLMDADVKCKNESVELFDSKFIAKKLDKLASKLNKMFNADTDNVAILVDQPDISYMFATDLIKRLTFDPVIYYNPSNFNKEFRNFTSVIVLTYSFDYYTTHIDIYNELAKHWHPHDILCCSLISSKGQKGKIPAIEYDSKEWRVYGYGMPNNLGNYSTNNTLSILKDD